MAHKTETGRATHGGRLRTAALTLALLFVFLTIGGVGVDDPDLWQGSLALAVALLLGVGYCDEVASRC